MAVKKAELKEKLEKAALEALEKKIDKLLEERLPSSKDGRVSFRMAELSIGPLLENSEHLLEKLREVYPDWIIEITSGPNRRIIFS